MAEQRGFSYACPRQFRQADEVVGGNGKGERHADVGEAAEPRLAQPAGSLQPAEDLPDALTLLLAERVAGWRMVRPSIAERRRAVSVSQAFCATCGVMPNSRNAMTNPACRSPCRRRASCDQPAARVARNSRQAYSDACVQPPGSPASQSLMPLPLQ